MALEFNTPEGSLQRAQTKPLTLQEEMEVVEIINILLKKADSQSSSTHDLLQRFLNHYQNLNHHMATTVGLWATDQPLTFTSPLAQ